MKRAPPWAWLPWAGLGVGVAIVAAIAASAARSIPEPPPAATPSPAAQGPKPSAPSTPTTSSPPPSPAPPSSTGPSMTREREEARDFQLHLAHEQCEDGAKRINTLSGKPPTDPSAIQLLSVCLRIGNVAWYKCVLRAGSRDEGAECTRRFMSLDDPP